MNSQRFVPLGSHAREAEAAAQNFGIRRQELHEATEPQKRHGIYFYPLVICYIAIENDHL